MADGDYGNISGYKAKTKSRWKHRHQGLTWTGLCHLLAMMMAKRASSPTRWISGTHGMGSLKIYDGRRLYGSGAMRRGGERQLGGCGAAGGRNLR
jgi:hypothetical protein